MNLKDILVIDGVGQVVAKVFNGSFLGVAPYGCAAARNFARKCVRKIVGSGQWAAQKWMLQLTKIQQGNG